MMGESLSPTEEMAYLTDHIDELHYRYLSAHESLEKLDEKRRLEGQIRNYLMVAPHEKKFIFPETAKILHLSAEAKDGFSGVRASIAWTALAAFAHNLLAQSWRKEFREIKTYSGFYQHNIMKGLIGSELMLTLMGYRESGEGVFTLDGPVDPDKVAHVSRDSLVALVESQILCSLYGELLRRGCNYSWLEILLYRESHPCSVEAALGALLYQYSSRRYFTPGSCRFDSYLEPQLYKSSYFYSPPNPHLPPYYQPHPPPDNPSVLPPPHSHMSTSSFYRCSNTHDHHPAPRVGSAVRTGQLVDLEAPFTTRSSFVLESDYQKKFDPSSSNSSQANENSRFIKREHGWDTYGAGNNYPSVENKNPPKYDSLDGKQLPHADWAQELKSLRIDDSQPSCLNSQSKSSEKINEKETKRISKSEIHSVPSSSQTLGRDLVKKSDCNYLSLKVKLNDTKWECPFCTYHNRGEKEVCEMCSKSRVSGKEIEPLVSGGRQCPKCTLVNEKGVTVCEACSTNLKDSPTYI